MAEATADSRRRYRDHRRTSQLHSPDWPPFAGDRLRRRAGSRGHQPAR